MESLVYTLSEKDFKRLEDGIGFNRDPNISKTQRRTGVVVNLGAMILMVTTFELVKNELLFNQITGFILLGLLLIIFSISFLYAFGKSGSWKMSHMKIKELDERLNDTSVFPIPFLQFLPYC